MPNVPLAEVPARADGGSLRPMQMAPLPEAIAALIRTNDLVPAFT